MNREKFDAYVQHAMDSRHCPGVAVGILKHNEWIYRRAFGFSQLEPAIPLSLETRFPLASVTKSITAMSVALLVDDGLLDWDVPVSRCLPEFRFSDSYVTRHATVCDLLSHRTGLPPHVFASWRLDESRSELMRRLRHLPFNASFREKYQYGNLLYNLVPYLVEHLSGERWEDFVKRRILGPLGMTQSTIEPDFRLPDSAVAEGYRIRCHDDGSFQQLEHVPFERRSETCPGGSGALFSTLSDMGQWLKVQLRDGECDGVRLISSENLKPMHRPQTLIPVDPAGYALSGVTMMAYGMGWRMRPHGGGTLIDHGGNTLGHSVVVGFMPESQIGVVVLANAALSDLPHVLLRSAVDHVLELPDRDWNTRFPIVLDPVGRHTNQRADEDASSSFPSRPLGDYQGRYSACGYPDFKVRLEAGRLQASTQGSLPWSEMRHCEGDVFNWYLSEFAFGVKVRFQICATGEVAAAAIPFEAAVDDIVFVRRKSAVNTEVAFEASADSIASDSLG